MPLFKKSIIGILKKLLILSAVLIILGLFLSYNNKEHQNYKLEQKDLSEVSNKGESFILKSEIFGNDKDGKPFLIKAQRIYYDQDKIKMYNVYIKIFLGNKETEITADQGVALLEKKQIFLDKKVHIMMSDGYKIDALSILIQYNKGMISSENPVIVQSKNDKISANGFKVVYSEKEKNITFYGHATANFLIN